jgi:hypothetical protein
MAAGRGASISEPGRGSEAVRPPKRGGIRPAGRRVSEGREGAAKRAEWRPRSPSTPCRRRERRATPCGPHRKRTCRHRAPRRLRSPARSTRSRAVRRSSTGGGRGMAAYRPRSRREPSGAPFATRSSRAASVSRRRAGSRRRRRAPPSRPGWSRAPLASGPRRNGSRRPRRARRRPHTPTRRPPPWTPWRRSTVKGPPTRKRHSPPSRARSPRRTPQREHARPRNRLALLPAERRQPRRERSPRATRRPRGADPFGAV